MLIKEIIKNKILLNILSLSSGQVFQLILNFFSFILVARFLSVEEFGHFGFLLAIFGIITKFVDLGINPILFKNVSSNKNSDTEIGSIFIFRILILIVMGILLNISMIIIDTNKQDILLINLFLLNIFFSSKDVAFRDLLAIPFKVDLRAHIPIVLSILDNALFLILVLLMPVFNGKLEYLVIIYVISNVPGMLILVVLFKKTYTHKFNIKSREVIKLLKTSLPLAVYVLFSFFYLQIDIIFIKNFRGDYETGLFSAAIRLVRPLIFIPTAVITTFFPLLLNLKISVEQRKKVIGILLKIISIIPILIVTIYGFKASEILPLLFGAKYLLASNVTTILFLELIFYFLNLALINFFIIHNNQSASAIYSIILLAPFSILGCFFIPTYGMNSAAVLKVIIGFVGSVYMFYKAFKMEIVDFIFSKRDILILVIFISFQYLISNLSVYIYILGSLLSVIGIFLFRIITKTEMKILLKLKNYTD